MTAMTNPRPHPSIVIEPAPSACEDAACAAPTDCSC